MMFIPKVYSLDHHGGPLVPLDTSNCLEDILDVSMTPVLTLNGRDRSDV